MESGWAEYPRGLGYSLVNDVFEPTVKKILNPDSNFKSWNPIENTMNFHLSHPGGASGIYIIPICRG